MEIGLSYGAISDPLEDQIIAQGFTVDKKQIDHLQADLDAIIRLRIRGFILDSQIDKYLQKLHKKVCQIVTIKH